MNLFGTLPPRSMPEAFPIPLSSNPGALPFPFPLLSSKIPCFASLNVFPEPISSTSHFYICDFLFLFVFLIYFIDYAITVVPFPPPSFYSILPTPSLPHSPPIVHVHGSYI